MPWTKMSSVTETAVVDESKQMWLQQPTPPTHANEAAELRKSSLKYTRAYTHARRAAGEIERERQLESARVV